MLFILEIILLLPLDEVPLPARNLLKLDLYNLGTMKGRKKYTSIMISTGCPFKCAFCSTLVYGKRVNTRSADDLYLLFKYDPAVDEAK